MDAVVNQPRTGRPAPLAVRALRAGFHVLSASRPTPHGGGGGTGEAVEETGRIYMMGLPPDFNGHEPNCTHGEIGRVLYPRPSTHPMPPENDAALAPARATGATGCVNHYAPMPWGR